MMTKHCGENERWLYGFRLEDKVPKDHLLRKIKTELDFDFIYDLVKDTYSHTGAPSIDPVVVFKLSLIGYLYNIPSERKLLEDASLNMAYLWFLGYDIDESLPDHSIMTKARIRFGPDVYREFFHRVVKACVDAELVEGETAFLDSTLIEAKGKLYDMRSKTLAGQLKDSTEGFIEKLFDDSNNEGPKMPRRTNDRISHPKDPDANIVKRGNKPAKLCYKGHIAVDGGKSRVITSVVATGGAGADEHYLPTLLAEHQELIGRPNYVVADRKYGSTQNFRILKAKSIHPAIRPNTGGKKPHGFAKESFYYDRKANLFICPNQKTLTKAKELPRKHQPYRSKKADCKNCRDKLLCTPDSPRKTIIRTKNETILSWARDMAKTPKAKELLRRRAVWPETIFAHGKTCHGMNEARFRRRWKVEIHLLLIAAAMNLEKLAKSRSKRSPANVKQNGFAKRRLLPLFVPAF